MRIWYNRSGSLIVVYQGFKGGVNMEIGDRIKNLRLKLGLTQEELADRCDLTKGFISQIERDLASPSVSSLFDILEALGSSPAEFFTQREMDKVHFSQEDYALVEYEEVGSSMTWVIPNAQKNMMEPVIVAIKPGGRTRTYTPSESEDFGYVLKGEVTLVTDSQVHHLKRGDSFYTGCNENRHLENNGAKKAEVIWVIAPPKF